MRFPKIFRRNDRWARQVDAYVDHRLTPVERELLEVRVEESESVAELLRNTQALKSSLGEMPEFDAPRSFALTPAMVAEPAPKPSRGPAVTMRLAQATSFAAIAAFGIVFAFDTVGTTSDADGSGANMASLETESAAEGDDMRITSDDEGETAGGTLAGSAENGDEPPAIDSKDGDEPFDAESPISALEAPRSAVEGSPRSLLPVYSALGGVFVLAMAAWAVSRHQVQRTQRI